MILKHRDRELLRFDWIQPFGVCHVELNRKVRQYLPLEFRDKAVQGRERDLVWGLEDWLSHRAAPMNRHFVRDVLISAGFNPGDPRYLRRLIEFCKGLSLNDVHWVVPDDFTGTWEAYNLYRNVFPESVAALVAAALGINHVPYRLARFKQRVCSVCPLFTSEKQGFVPVGKLLTREQIASDRRFADIFLLDAVILNDDRHLGNFGFLIDNDTNEICGTAPAFDNGHAFFARPCERFSEGTPALYEQWTAYPGLDCERARERLMRLRGFRLKKDARYNLSHAAFKSASDFLTRRIDTLLDTFANTAQGGPVKIEFTGPGRLLQIIRDNPGLRRNTLAKLAGLTERTTKRHLSQLKGRIVFRGVPKTGGYYALDFKEDCPHTPSPGACRNGKSLERSKAKQPDNHKIKP